MGLMTDLILLPMGLAEFRQGATDVGMAYVALMVLLPTATLLAAWLSGRETPLCPVGDAATRKDKWLSRLRRPVDCGPLTPLALLVAATGLGAGLMIALEGEWLAGALCMVLGVAFPPAAALPWQWITGGGKGQEEEQPARD